jgi:uncharacterized lipoprotein YmbA
MDRAHGFLSCAAVALLLTGCLGPGTTRSAKLFVLNATATPDGSTARATDLRLGVGRISLPELLNRPQIITRTGPNRVRAADFSQWAEPLERSIPRVLSENLARLTGTDQVSVYPWPTQMEIDFKVEIAVIRFEGNTDREVSLAARWRWIRADGSQVHPLQASSYAESAADRSKEAMVAAMSRALASLSRDIASAIAVASP